VKALYAYTPTADICDHIKNVSVSPDTVQCCNTNLCNVGDSKPVSAGPLKCYQGIPDINSTVPITVPVTCAEGSDMCLTYKYRCSSGDTSCTKADISKATVKEASICSKKVSQGTNMCTHMVANSPDPSKVVCCYKSLCNAPEKA